MKNFVLAIAFTGFTVLALQAQQPAPPSALTVAPAAPAAPATNAIGPKIKFEETMYDFGKVQSGTAVKHTYTFTNIGDEALEIKGVQPQCGCTAANDWTKRVEPGPIRRKPRRLSMWSTTLTNPLPSPRLNAIIGILAWKSSKSKPTSRARNF